MTNYVFAYSGGKGVAADEAERDAQMARWGEWFAALGAAVVDGGAATGSAKTAGPGGVVTDGGSRGLTGYSIVSADSLDAAVELAKGCPVLEIGGAVEVMKRSRCSGEGVAPLPPGGSPLGSRRPYGVRCARLERLKQMPEPRTRVERVPANARYDRASIERVLDRSPLAHVAFVDDGTPYCIPTLHARVDDCVLIHGSRASRMVRVLQSGAPACVTVTVLDGLVLARSAFETGANYDSVVLHGSFSAVEESRKVAALESFMEQLLPGRWGAVRQPTRQELNGTTILEMAIEKAAVKTKTGGPDDDDSADAELDVWAGVLPLAHRYGLPEPSPALRSGIALPDHVRRLTGTAPHEEPLRREPS